MAIVTTVLLGVIYPLVVTGLAQVIFPDKANGQLISNKGASLDRGLSASRFTGPGISIRVLRLRNGL